MLQTLLYPYRTSIFAYTIVLKTTTISNRRIGDGIARVQGFAVFVKNAKVGQKVRIRVEQVGNRYATATMAS